MRISQRASTHSWGMHSPQAHAASAKGSAFASLAKLSHGPTSPQASVSRSFGQHLARTHAAFNPSHVVRSMSHG